MHYETLLLTRQEQPEYSALVRPAEMTDGDITTLNAIFHAATHETGLSAGFPGLYCFPVGDYALLVRHYAGGSEHQSAVVEGAAIKLGDGGFDGAAAAQMVTEQATLLAVPGTARESKPRPDDVAGERMTSAPFTATFLERREQERLFLPFTEAGQQMLAAVVADSRFETPLYFAFGTNSDVLAQLERLARIDVVSFVKTERASLRDRATNQVTRYLDEGSGEPDYEAARTQRMKLYEKPRTAAEDKEKYEDTQVGAQAMPIQSFRRNEGAGATHEDDEYDPDDTVLTMAQIPAAPHDCTEESNPLRRMTKKLSSLLSPRKTE